MIHGAHVIIYSKDAEADRRFFRDVLKYEYVDAGHGWLIFALPPAEVALHPSEHNENWFLCARDRAAIKCRAPDMSRSVKNGPRRLDRVEECRQTRSAD